MTMLTRTRLLLCAMMQQSSRNPRDIKVGDCPDRDCGLPCVPGAVFAREFVVIELTCHCRYQVTALKAKYGPHLNFTSLTVRSPTSQHLARRKKLHCAFSPPARSFCHTSSSFSPRRLLNSSHRRYNFVLFFTPSRNVLRRASHRATIAPVSVSLQQYLEAVP